MGTRSTRIDTRFFYICSRYAPTGCQCVHYVPYRPFNLAWYLSPPPRRPFTFIFHLSLLYQYIVSCCILDFLCFSIGSARVSTLHLSVSPVGRSQGTKIDGGLARRP